MMVCLAAGYCLFSSAVRAQDFTVNSTADVFDAKPGDGICSTGNTLPGTATLECTLRAAINEANASPGFHTITLPAGTYYLTIPEHCSAGDNGTYNQYCVLGKMSIVGAGAGATVLDAAGNSRVMLVGATGQLQLSGVTIQNGRQTGGDYGSGGGGGISNLGVLSVSNSAFFQNRADVNGGGIYSKGTLTVIGATFQANNGGGYGGGIFQIYGGTLDIKNCLFSHNLAGDGGGLYIFGTQTQVTGSTFMQNSASGYGGGLTVDESNDGLFRTVNITNSTIAGNQAGRAGGGAAFFSFATAHLNNVTITGNSPSGITDKQAKVILQNTIVAVNPTLSSTDCETNLNISNMVSNGHNLIGNPANCNFAGDSTNILGQDPLLGMLADNGGFTQTVALGANSPAIDAGSPLSPGSAGTACAPLDQRGYVRPIGGACDIGAFETGRGLALAKVAPSHGGNIAPVVAIVTGTAFPVGATIKLSRVGQADILGTSATLEPTGTALSAIFDITGAAPGQWDLVLTTPDNHVVTLPGAFTVSSGTTQKPKLWSQVVGRSAVRAGYPARYSIVYGNNGDIDALAVPLAIVTPVGYQLNLYTSITSPPSQAGQAITDWSQVPVQVLPMDTAVNTNLLIPVIPAGFQGYLDISILVPSSAPHGSTYELFAALGDPFFAPALDPTVTAQMAAGAETYAQQSLGITPPATAAANIQNYMTNQLQMLVNNGRAALAQNLGIRSQYYSLGQMVIDGGEFAAAQPATAAPSLSTSSRLLFAAISSASPTGGGILPPGTSGGKEPDPTIVPDPKDAPPPKGITPGECRDIANHNVSASGKFCVPKPNSGCAILQNPILTDPNCAIIPIIDAVDPNDKGGAQGVTSQHFTVPGSGLGYTIYFENLAAATAPAQQVVVTDQLDLTNLDPGTFSFGQTSFTGYFLKAPPRQNHFVGALDLRPTENVIVKVEGTFNPVSGLITWVFTSLDPITELLTTDPTAGFLPPNVTPPMGEGRVTFQIMPKAGAASGSKTCNQASVVFDKNPAILTPTWCNAYDLTPPVSYVQALPSLETTPTFTVSWSGTDVGSGIADYNIYVSDNGGAFALWQSQVAAASAQYTGQVGHSYGFVSQATDSVGNVEGLRTVADTTTTVGAASVAPSITVQPVSQTIAGGSTVTFTAAATGTPAPTVQWQLSADAGATFSNISGATTATLTFVGLVAQNGYLYRAVFTNAAGTATSTVARLSVTANPATHFAISAPGSVISGTAFNITVTALDQFNSPATAYTGTVHLSSSDFLAILPADVTFTAAMKGTGTFSVTLNSVGSQKITVVDTSNASVAGTSNAIAVTLTVHVLGDVNGDGVVNCTDIAIVKASFGLKKGQTGFDPRADVNNDGIVNIIDLSIVAKQLPAGTTCP